MHEGELFIRTLRVHVRHLQSLLNDLEGHEMIGSVDCLYSQLTLQDVIKGLSTLEEFSSKRGTARTTRAEWLN